MDDATFNRYTASSYDGNSSGAAPCASFCIYRALFQSVVILLGSASGGGVENIVQCRTQACR